MTQPEPIVLQHRTMTCEGKLLGDDITLMQQKSQGDGVETLLSYIYKLIRILRVSSETQSHEMQVI